MFSKNPKVKEKTLTAEKENLVFMPDLYSFPLLKKTTANKRLGIPDMN